MAQANLLKISRLESLTDGVFAIAMTILVFSIQVPEHASVANLPHLLHTTILAKIFIYMGSFIILAAMWIAVDFLHGFLKHINRPYLWLNIFYLMAAGIVPFSASLVIDYPESPSCIYFYVINLLFACAMQFAIWQCGAIFNLYNSAYIPCVRRIIRMRLVIPPVFYIASLFIASWSTSIAFAILLMPPLFHMIPGKVDRYIKRIEQEN